LNFKAPAIGSGKGIRENGLLSRQTNSSGAEVGKGLFRPGLISSRRKEKGERPPPVSHAWEVGGGPIPEGGHDAPTGKKED